jgi:hypothetical protein
MPKISKSASTVFSLVLAISLLAIILFFAIVMPFVIEKAPIMMGVKAYFVEKDAGVVFWTWFYLLMFTASVCCGTLIVILRRVRTGLVFTPLTVSLIRFLSWGCMFIAAVCLAVVYYFHMSYILTLAAGFLGLCLRVVKNVLEHATELKDENDLTV